MHTSHIFFNRMYKTHHDALVLFIDSSIHRFVLHPAQNKHPKHLHNHVVLGSWLASHAALPTCADSDFTHQHVKPDMHHGHNSDKKHNTLGICVPTSWQRKESYM